MESNFEKDLNKESLLGKYLDRIYLEKFDGFNVQRVFDLHYQHQGIDLSISKDGRSFNIDEKAQLDYLESDLPTFAFEISYLKNGVQNLGWLYDSKKITDFYFTVTAIYCNTYNVPESGFKKCKIHSVDRRKLINLLSKRGLTYQRVIEINNEIRANLENQRISIQELNPFSEGVFFYSKNGKAEQPINIVMKMDFLLKNKVAKRIH